MIDLGTLADAGGIRRLLPSVDDLFRADETMPAIGDDLSLEEVERLHIEAVVAKCGGNKTRAAEILGIDRKSLYRKIERLGIRLSEDSAEP